MTTIKANFATGNTALFNSTMNGIHDIGGKKQYAIIPLELCKADERYQRNSSISDRAIGKLVRLWDDNLMDPVKAIPHKEESLFYIVDGWHRVCAMKQKGEEYIIAEILTNFPENANELLVMEAQLFATQNNAVDRLTPAQTHKAKCILGIPENLIIDRVCKKYGVNIGTARNRNKKINTVTAYNKLERLVKASNEETIDNIFYILCASKWNLGTEAFSKRTLEALYNIFAYHKDKQKEICEALLPYMRDNECKHLRSLADAAYPLRYESTQLALFLEDYLHEQIGLPYVYKETKEAQRINRNKVKKHA